ncbi:sugar ABC transporter permease [Lactonifactor longoviformis]|uniref:Carbohydrate ABC transporter membrane protein 1, CUT1 family (TC 3.A.1.1.-) n=1 Tax=Lactonifactor longoviformis DSM 17459 TaxID=1122155 RepID=A0A1M5BZ23_9CLOT|nr:sugar ABC transporter permease [Lactonifactor longoviformis]POP33630.1 sugar ABC transporter permease [Lactonifactor longoviformis]SHF47587.1 carbohydrate ABC transporter membrane protein 1, CUT1 family (TC 3.A.1.1.-) [Lactonifactor longoviformis DSM 17459]
MHWLSTRRAKTVMVLPTLIIYAVFIIVPVFVAIYYSFTDYSGLGKAEFVGIQNYTRMFHDALFLIAFRNTVVVLICSAVFLLAGSFLMALLMNVSFRGNAFFKMVVFAPYVIAPIIIGIIWGYILNPNYGLVNSVLRSLGLDVLAIEWIGGTKWSPLALAIVFTWQVLGFHATIFLSGIKAIPGDIYEACSIDGANAFQRLFYVTIPMLKETFIINIVLIVTGVFKIYELVYQMTGGGPAHQSELLTSYMYFTVFSSRRYGYGMAIAVAILVLSIIGSFSYIKITTRKQRSEA